MLKLFDVESKRYAFDSDTMQLFLVESDRELEKYGQSQDSKAKDSFDATFLQKIVLNASNICPLIILEGSEEYPFEDSGNCIDEQHDDIAMKKFLEWVSRGKGSAIANQYHDKFMIYK